MKEFLTIGLLVALLLGGVLAPFGALAAPDDSSSANQATANIGGGASNVTVPTNQGTQSAGTGIMQGPPAPNLASDKNFNAIGLACGLTSLMNCLAQAPYYFIYVPSSWAVAAAGTLFDIMAAITLNSNVYTQSFADAGWKAARDLVNIFFIFVLLAIAIATILQIEQYGAKSLLVNVIIVALLINFSLVITKVVIDASNIVALQFYTQSGTPKSGGPDRSYMQSAGNTVQERNLSAAFVAGAAPQAIFMNSSGFDQFVNFRSDKIAIFIAICLMSAVINIILAYALFMAGFIFLGRTIMLIFLMVVAPLAFVAWILPGTKSIAEKWWSELLNQSFVAPVFLFFIYLILRFVTSASFLGALFSESPNAQATIQDILLMTFLNTAVLSTMLIIAVRIAKKMSGEMGTMAISLGKAATGMVLGGAVGIAGRQLVGRGASAIASSEAYKTFTAKNPFMGRMGFKALDTVAGGSFDVRATSLGGKAGIGKAGGGGGYEMARKGIVREKVQTAKRIERDQFGRELKVNVPVEVPGIGKMEYVDESGQKQYVTEEVGAKEAYTRNIEKQRPVVFGFKEKGFQASRTNQEAAQEIRRGKKSVKELVDEALKEAGEVSGKPAEGGKPETKISGGGV